MGLGSATAKKGKKGKKGVVEEIIEEPKAEEPPPSLPEPEPVIELPTTEPVPEEKPADDAWGDWGTTTTSKKKKKKGKKSKIPEPEPEPEPVVEDPAAVQEPNSIEESKVKEEEEWSKDTPIEVTGEVIIHNGIIKRNLSS